MNYHTSIVLVCFAATVHAAEPVNFSHEILPILSESCLSCHGPDKAHRQADLRLDTREGALGLAGETVAIVPGKPEESELLVRVQTNDDDLLMPPADSHKTRLNPKQVELIKRWISEGAVWGKHWSFETPVKAAVPTDLHPVDYFIQARLAKEGMSPSPMAEPHTLVRRLSFDLTGLPPTLDEVTRFDGTYTAYEAMVDRLLASPHFGERMAMWWLDAARYSDTDGFQADANRENWPWRDWVVEAFNANMRFDQFTLEQFAGDLLPNATPEQVLATCFHRNHMTNGEGGRDPEESRVDYVLDRVNTMGAIWLGLSLNCTQCHSHKFDPISQADYYGLSAFFNSIDEDGKAGKDAKPFLTYESRYVARAIDEAQQLTNERKAIEANAKQASEQPFMEWIEARKTEVRGGFHAWHPLFGVLESSEGTHLTQESDAVVQASGPHPNQDDYRLIASVKLPRVTGLKLEVLLHSTHTKSAFTRGESGQFILTDIKVQVRRLGSSQVRDIAVKSAVADFNSPGKGYGDIKGVLDDDPRNGWTTKDAPSLETHAAVFALVEPLVLADDEELIFELRQRSTLGDANIGRFRVSATDQPGPAVTSIGPAPLEQLAIVSEPDDKLLSQLREQFLADYAPYQAAKRAFDRATAQLNETKAAKKATVMVLAERPELRDTFVLERGVWDKHGEGVRRGGLSSITPLDSANPSRADLARWLTSSKNPLTARVLVNHLWQICFSTGLVKTTEDFGLQGERPIHPELLDWLAVECVECGWDIKHLLKIIVTSATYRQSSSVSESQLERDPDNKWLARGARFRLPAWMLRDAALRASGLIHPAIGGPPVKPYQPEGVWEENFMGRFTYEPSQGRAQYRRTLYAFWRRSIAPTFLFDSAQRRACEVRTSRTNTPLHALTLLNDENYLEASRALAMLTLANPEPIQEMARRVLSRTLRENELNILARQRDRALTYYRQNANEATKFLVRGQSMGEPTLDDDRAAPELAAHAVVASLLFNLDEAITHE